MESAHSFRNTIWCVYCTHMGIKMLLEGIAVYSILDLIHRSLKRLHDSASGIVSL